MNICKFCNKTFEYSKELKLKGYTKTKCNSCAVNERRKEQRKKLKEIKKKGCTYCGYNKNTAALHFHHIANNKEFTISGNHCRSWNKIEKEIAKCIIICSNCHHEIHNPEQNL